MSLITKKLMALQPGTQIEITLNDSDRSKFVGTVNENDFEESIEILNEDDELVLGYEEIKSVKIIRTVTELPVSQPVPQSVSSVNIEQIRGEKKAPKRVSSFADLASIADIEKPEFFIPVSKPVEKSEYATVYGAKRKGMDHLSFVCDVITRTITDKMMDDLFKSLPTPDKKIVNNTYQSYKAKLKDNDYKRCLEIVNRLADDLDDADLKIADNSWLLVGYMATRIKDTNASEYYRLANRFDLLAINDYTIGKFDTAVAYACAAIRDNIFSDNEDEVYTIAAKCSYNKDDLSGFSEICDSKTDSVNQPRFKEFIKFIYRENLEDMPEGISAKKVADYLRYTFPSTEIADAMPKKTVPNTNTVVKYAEDDAYTFENPDEKIKGEITTLAWMTNKGQITADNKKYDFEYKDISDLNLKAKIEKIFTRDLVANNLVVPVIFTAKCDKATDIAELIVPKIPKPKALGFGFIAEPSDDSSSVDNVKLGRAFLSNTTDSQRFEKAYKFFKAAVEESNYSAYISDFMGCCLPIFNKTGDEKYLQEAYEVYKKYEPYAQKGLTSNTIALDLMLKMDKKYDALTVVDRILSDPKIPVETRLNYILHRANILYSLAEICEVEKAAVYFEGAKTSFLDWEQRYLERLDLKNNVNFRKMYYNIVMIGISKCFIGLGDKEKAEELIKKVLFFDRTNEIAKNLMNSIHKNAETDSVIENENNNDSDDEVVIDDYVDEYETEETSAQVYEYKDVSGWKALSISENDIFDYIFSINTKSRIPYSIAYLKAASSLNEKFRDFYEAYSYAVNNPIEYLDYSLSNIVLKFSELKLSEYQSFKNFAEASAFLRATFYHVKNNDFFINSAQINAEVFELIPSLKNVFAAIESFRTKTGMGMDLYADYHVSLNDASNSIEKVRKAAKDMYDRYLGRFFHESISQKRFKLTKALLFEKGRITDQILSCIKENDTQKCMDLSPEISSRFIRSGAVISVNNIDTVKLDNYIDGIWVEAGADSSIHERKSSQLMGSLRNNLKTPVRNAIELYCQYYELIAGKNESNDSENTALYRKLKDDLSEALATVKYECENVVTDSDEIKLGCYIIRATIKEIARKINGNWSDDYRKFFFVDFLLTDNILLDDNYLPELSTTLCDLESFNILARIKMHIENHDKTFAEHAEEIYSKEPSTHDFGTAIKIANYLNFIGDSSWTLPENHEAFDELGRKQLRECYDEFNIEMCSALSNGRIRMSDEFLVNIDNIAQYLFQFSLDSSNYGFFFKFVDNCKDKIHAEAKEYGDILKKQLDKLTDEEKIEKYVYDTILGYIDNQLFTVAEEMMSRILKGDFDGESELPNRIAEYINQFWDEFQQNFKVVSNIATNLKKLVSASMAAKDRKGGQALVDSWPLSTRSGSEQIKTLLTLLGWSEIEVEESKIDGAPKSFTVKQNPHIFNNRQYAHTISAFGTSAYETGFHIVCIFGYTSAERIVDYCRKFDSVNGNKIILLDYALTAADRRKLAKMMKQTTFANTYMFIDRVSLIYLANHYRGGGGDDNNRTLMAISMPFTFYQPYSLGSSSSVPPEMFIGRKDELLSVESVQGANLIYGGRQLGKSAILKKAKVEVDDRENGRIASFIDIKDHNCERAAKKISRDLFVDGILKESEITEDWDDLSFAIKRSIQENKISYFLLLLDEADCFIESCQELNYQPLGVLKDIQQTLNGKFKFVIAGLHNVIKFKREVALGKNSVITHLSSINIKPFNYKDAVQLLTEPLGYLGFDFGTDETPLMEILSHTNYFPGLIQLYSYKLVESMKNNYAGYSETNTPGYVVSKDHINKVLADRQFLDEIKDKFEITLRLGDGNHYYIIALILAMLFTKNEAAEGYLSADLVAMSENIGFSLYDVVSKEHLDALLEELCDLNIFKKIGQCYAFRTKNFRDLLGTNEQILEEIVELLDPDNKE